jgi:hypothetical protein
MKITPLLLLMPFISSLLTADPDPAKTLQPDHPRVLITDASVDALKSALSNDPRLQAYQKRLILHADELKAEPLPVYEKPDGFRLLPVSRTVIRRVTALTLAWSLTGDESYARRAREDLLAVAAFPDWNPIHFLDTAEMAAAVGIGLDGLWSFLSAEDRLTLRHAIQRHAIAPYLATHTAVRYGSGVDGVGWVDKDTNWNAVCNGGILIAALAAAEPDDLVSMNQLRAVIAATRQQLPLTLKSYEPDGAYPEGVMYWGYGSFYLAMTLHALEQAIDSDLGLIDAFPGLAHTGTYILHAHGPRGWPLTYADANLNRKSGSHGPARLYFAGRFDNPFLADLHHLQLGLAENSERISAWDLLWYPSEKGEADTLPREALFRGPTPLAVWRSAWNDPNALYVSMIAGDNPGPHGHLDLGSFELRALGESWIIDAGKDDYGLPGYWEYASDGRRWTYFNLGTQGHNLPMIGGKQQNTPARADFSHFAGGENPGALIDLSAVYAPAKLRRGIRLLHNRSSVLVQDEITGTDEEIRWGLTLNPDVTVTIEDNTATLTLNGKNLKVEVLTPENITWNFHKVPDQPAGNKIAAGGTRLEFTIPKPGPETQIAVWFQPLTEQTLSAPDVQPLSQWENVIEKIEN